jgi:hypothetical protein
MPNTFIRLPEEAGNTGQKVAYVSEVQGADTVLRPKVIIDREESVVGVFRAISTLQSVQAAAQNGTTTGFFWLINGSASGRNLRIRRLSLQYNFIGTTTLATLPRIILQRITFAGTPTGAPVLGVNIDGSSVTTAVGDLRTASTGLTVTLTANTQLAAALPPIAQVSGTAASYETTPTLRSELIDADASEDLWIVVPPGQGLVMYQVDAGTASDTRRFLYNVVWDECLV